MNQNLLIVDDEDEILAWLDELFRYDYPDEIGVYTASSGAEALRWLDQVKVDAVLTDIRMPEMDGITLFQRIKENWPRCKTIFLTGYKNFDNMYELVRQKDVRYLLKSEEDQVILETVKQALVEARIELEQEKDWVEQKELLRQAEIVRKRECMHAFLAGKTDAVWAEEQLKRLGFSIVREKQFLIFLVRQDSSKEKEYDNQILDAEKLALILKDNMPLRVDAYVHIQDTENLFLFVSRKTEKEEWESIKNVVQGALEYSQEIYRNTCGGTFSAVIGALPVDFVHAPDEAAKLRRIMVGYVGAEREVILQADVALEKLSGARLSELMEKIPSLISWLELRKRSEYFLLLTEAADAVEARSHHDVYALELYYSISVLLLKFINENHMNEQLAFKTGLYKLTRADMHENWREAMEYLFEVSDSIFGILTENENTLADRALKRVVDYIDEHLTEDLPLSRLAKIGGFNESYLSRLFRQVCKMTVTEYICAGRMKLAQNLLSESDEKIKDIAVKSGYPSPHSFTRSFRNYMGISPAEYRELHMKKSEEL